MDAKDLWGFDLKPWIGSVRGSHKAGKGLQGQLYVAKRLEDLPETILNPLHEWQKKQIKAHTKVLRAQTATGLQWFLIVSPESDTEHHYGVFKNSSYQRTRDEVGKLLPEICDAKLESLTVETFGLSDEHTLGMWVGFELAAYDFNQSGRRRQDLPLLISKNFSAEVVTKAANLVSGTNIARHFVNLPANELNPTTYAIAVKELFTGFKTSKVQVWDSDKLRVEKMNLVLAVGGASQYEPCLIHIRYRPKGVKLKPIAIVGKGITFDTGGLDIKPTSAMRIMKKDMGGSASVLGLAYWAEKSQVPLPIDFYLVIAENSVSSTAFRPGDIVRSRQGLRVEIDNTDAEGRLVMADAIDVALSQENDDKPRLLIDASTLTGAMRVAVGLDLIGMFANDDGFAEKLQVAGFERGDLCWRMPLYEPYERKLKSDFADLSNADGSGHGGAITAALFLHKFVGKTPWIHLDFNAYCNSPQGAYRTVGGNGQGVQALARFMEMLT